MRKICSLVMTNHPDRRGYGRTAVVAQDSDRYSTTGIENGNNIDKVLISFIIIAESGFDTFAIDSQPVLLLSWHPIICPVIERLG
jgi:hypothetical protein